MPVTDKVMVGCIHELANVIHLRSVRHIVMAIGELPINVKFEKFKIREIHALVKMPFG